jgi:ABC-type glutathione transport system ATPase component
VDEVLSVGDIAFQKKCLGKMDEVAKGGRTVLFVSHNMQAISTLTNSAIVLNEGSLILYGKTREALTCYRELYKIFSSDDYVDEKKETGVTRARVITSESNNIHRFGKPLSFEFEIKFKKKPKSGGFAFQIISENDMPIAHLWVFDSDQPWSSEGRLLLRCDIENPRLYMGRYTIVTHLADSASSVQLEKLEDICSFEVVMEGIYREYEWFPDTCTYLEDARWSVFKS